MNEDCFTDDAVYHQLSGKWNKHRECHIGPDWLLIYLSTEAEVILERTGSHSDLFK